MDTMTMDLKKIQLAQYILGLSDSSMIDSISRFISTYNTDYNMKPCCYSVEEMAERLTVAESNITLCKGETIEEILKDAESW